MKNGKVCDDSDSSCRGYMKCMMTLNVYLMPLNKILEIKYTYGSLKQQITKNILWRVTIFFISQRMVERGGLFRAKRR